MDNFSMITARFYNMRSPSLLLIFVFKIVCLWLLFLSPASYSNESPSGNAELNIITSINHDKQLVVINDKAYTMLIGLEVYIYSLENKIRKKEKVNRYALKKGDIVYFRSEVRNRQSYVSKIIISR